MEGGVGWGWRGVGGGGYVWGVGGCGGGEVLKAKVVGA